MRKGEDTSSSFDLFLDTICNTFGGIVFLAILLAIMCQNRSVVKTPDTDGQHATPDQIRQAMAKLDGMSAQYELLKLSLAAIPEAGSAVDDSEYLNLLEDQRQLKSKLEAAVTAETNASRELIESLETNALERSENDSVPNDLDEARKLVAKLRADYKSLVEAKLQTIRLPRVRSSRSASVLMLVQDGSLYLAKTPSLFGQGFNGAQVSTAVSADSGIQVRPKAGTGWDLASPQSQTEFKNILKKASIDSNSITVAIWPDSFSDFAQLRKMMIAEKTLYQLWPQSAGEILKVHIGGGQSSVQ